jgi:hypothetical protein
VVAATLSGMSRTRKRRREPAAGPDGLTVLADYRLSPFGPGCFASISVEDDPPRTVRGEDVHDALHLVMDEVAALADAHHRPLLTMHTLAGDPVAFGELARAHGFANCVGAVHVPVE